MKTRLNLEDEVNRLKKEVQSLKRIIKRIISFAITVILIVPWSAIFLGTQFNIWVGIISLVWSIILLRYLKKKGIV